MIYRRRHYTLALSLILSLTLGCDDEPSERQLGAGEAGEGLAGMSAGARAGAGAGAGAEVGGQVAGVEPDVTGAGAQVGGVEAGVEAGAQAGGAGAGAEAGVSVAYPWQEEAERLARDGQLALTREPQPTGDPAEGLRYLMYGDFVGGGIPYEIYMRFVGPSEGNALMREGDSAQLPRDFNLFTLDGAQVVGGITCFGCHSSYINGELVLGVGNSFSNFAASPPEWLSGVLETVVRNSYGEESPEWAAFVDYGRGSARVAPYTRAPFRGVNPAFVIEAAASASRDPNTFAWLEEPLVPLEPFAEGISSDVPPWWNVKKKAALYYNGMGRGRFSKMLMQISVVAIRNVEQAAEIHSHFADLLAWLEALEPPAYQGALDAELAGRGQTLFEANCTRCHGSYQSSVLPTREEQYPNLLISLEQVGTDPAYAQQMSARPSLSNWINEGWYGRSLDDPRASEQGLGPAQMQAFPLDGYVAPPLDGVWVTAPYLHNGSVPTLKALLNSATRPTRWSRDFNSSEYDLEQVGWPHQQVTEAELSALEDPSSVYDTTVRGYGNQGHTFADHLSDEERAALLEYLKSI